MDIIWAIWSQPKIFLLIGTVCFVLIAVLRFARSGPAYQHKRYEYRSYSRSSSWPFIERVAAIMGIIAFIIQVAQWVYPWL